MPDPLAASGQDFSFKIYKLIFQPIAVDQSCAAAPNNRERLAKNLRTVLVGVFERDVMSLKLAGHERQTPAIGHCASNSEARKRCCDRRHSNGRREWRADLDDAID